MASAQFKTVRKYNHWIRLSIFHSSAIVLIHEMEFKVQLSVRCLSLVKLKELAAKNGHTDPFTPMISFFHHHHSSPHKAGVKPKSSSSAQCRQSWGTSTTKPPRRASATRETSLSP